MNDSLFETLVNGHSETKEPRNFTQRQGDKILLWAINFRKNPLLMGIKLLYDSIKISINIAGTYYIYQLIFN